MRSMRDATCTSSLVTYKNSNTEISSQKSKNQQIEGLTLQIVTMDGCGLAMHLDQIMIKGSLDLLVKRKIRNEDLLLYDC